MGVKNGLPAQEHLLVIPLVELKNAYFQKRPGPLWGSDVINPRSRTGCWHVVGMEFGPGMPGMEGGPMMIRMQGGPGGMEMNPEHMRMMIEDGMAHGGAQLAGVEFGDAVATLEQLERAYILHVLAREAGHQSRTAERLGIDRRTLYRKLKQYRADPSTRS